MADSNSRMQKLLELTVKEQASDLHLATEHPPVLRISGRLIPLVKEPVLTNATLKELIFSIMTPEQQERLPREKEIDFSYTFKNDSRFRINVFYQMRSIAAALRLIPSHIPNIEELNLPSALHKFTKASQGFVLVTGPSGHGKSTTLAALIDEINHTRTDHIVTIEDPIEYVFSDDLSIVDQREVGEDTATFASALRSVFRQDPDVIMIGEMRGPKTMSAAITAAETGHLVFATLHTNSAAQTIHRITDSFPAAQQGQIRAQLSGSLLGIVSQRLIPRNKGGLIPACEVMFATPAISNLIRENKIYEIPFVIETSGEMGMVSLNRSLAKLVRDKEITMENALDYSLNPIELESLV